VLYQQRIYIPTALLPIRLDIAARTQLGTYPISPTHTPVRRGDGDGDTKNPIPNGVFFMVGNTSRVFSVLMDTGGGGKKDGMDLSNSWNIHREGIVLANSDVRRIVSHTQSEQTSDGTQIPNSQSIPTLNQQSSLIHILETKYGILHSV
jgi:hypothetical protein